MGDAAIKFYNGSHWLKLSASGFDSWMVWNPGRAGASKISDLPDEDWDKFICIEPIVLAKPILLEPGKTLNAQLTVSAIDSVKS